MRSIQDSLNTLNGSTALSNQACINSLAGTTARSQQDAFNVWAGTTGLSRQAAANVKAGLTAYSLQAALDYLAGTPAINSPLDIAGYVVWYKADALTFQDSGLTTPASANNDPVGGMVDLTSNNRHLIQATAGFRPLLKTSTLNSMNTLLFDGTDDFLKVSGGFTWTRPETIYLVYKFVTATANDQLIDGNSDGSGAIYVSNAGTGELTGYAGAAAPTSSGASVNTWAILTICFDGANSYMKINKLARTTGNSGAANMSGFTLGASSSGTVAGNVQIAELVGYNTAHTDLQNTQVINYLANRWAITV